MTSATVPAGLAFDPMAERYDALFTVSAIGRAQRSAVWAYADNLLRPGLRMLELNCGTGEDAVHFAALGLEVTACDASPAMVAHARAKAAAAVTAGSVTCVLRPIEAISALADASSFDCVFSNFSGLNCVADLGRVSADLARLTRPGAPALLCLSTRLCAWELAWYLLRGDRRRALRRWSGRYETRLHGVTFPVFYPTLRELRRAFAPHFRLASVQGIGIFVPPSYTESCFARRPALLRLLARLDDVVRGWPCLRALGDHVLLHLERRSA